MVGTRLQGSWASHDFLYRLYDVALGGNDAAPLLFSPPYVLMSMIFFGVNFFSSCILALVCQILLMCCVPCAGSLAAARDLTAVNKRDTQS